MSGKLFYKQLLKVVVDLLHIYSNSYYIKPEIKCAFTLARSKTRKPWKSQKSRKFFSEIFKSEFTILATGQNRKLGNKKTRNNFSEISEFSICHFFIFQKNFFNILKHRNSRSQMFFKIGVLNNFAIFKGKHLC